MLRSPLSPYYIGVKWRSSRTFRSANVKQTDEKWEKKKHWRPWKWAITSFYRLRSRVSVFDRKYEFWNIFISRTVSLNAQLDHERQTHAKYSQWSNRVRRTALSECFGRVFFLLRFVSKSNYLRKNRQKIWILEQISRTLEIIHQSTSIYLIVDFVHKVEFWETHLISVAGCEDTCNITNNAQSNQYLFERRIVIS